MPLPCLLDVDNDSIKDMIVSPFDGSQNVSEDYKSCWFYKNTGTNSSPVFKYQANNFLQGDMIDVGSGAIPVLYDMMVMVYWIFLFVIMGNVIPLIITMVI